MTLTTHPLKGEIVQVTRIQCAGRGVYTEYRAYFEHSGTEIFTAAIFKESVAKVFRAAGHSQVTYQRGHVIPMAKVDVVLGTEPTKKGGERYIITHVYASDGSVHEVATRERNSKKLDKPITKDTLAEHKRKRQLQRQRTQGNIVGMFSKPSKFAQGERLHAYQRTNSFSLVVIGDEWVLFTKKYQDKVAA